MALCCLGYCLVVELGPKINTLPFMQAAERVVVPSQPQRITPGLKNNNFSLSPCPSSTSHYTTTFFFSNHNSDCTHKFGTQTQKNNNTCFGACLYSSDTQHGNLHPAGRPKLFCGPTQEPLSATANTGKTRKRFGKIM